MEVQSAAVRSRPVVAGGSGILRRVATSETARLLDVALAKDPAALGHLLERLRPRIVLWAAARLTRSLRARVEPDDVAQLVLLAAHEGFSRFAGRTQPQLLAWIFSIAENRIRDLARHFGAAKRDAEEGIAAEILGARTQERFSRTSPSQVAARQEALRRMHEAIERLPEELRDILRLRDLEMRDYKEVVDRMGLASVGAARTLRCRALIALRSEMGSER